MSFLLSIFNFIGKDLLKFLGERSLSHARNNTKPCSWLLVAISNSFTSINLFIYHNVQRVADPMYFDYNSL